MNIYKKYIAILIVCIIGIMNVNNLWALAADYASKDISDYWTSTVSVGSGSCEDLNADVKTVSDVVHTGKGSGYIRANFTLAGNTFCDLRYRIPASVLKANTTYKFTYWIKKKNTGIHYLKYIKDNSEQRLGGTLAWYQTSDWSAQSRDFTTSANVSDIYIIFDCQGYESQWHNSLDIELWIDDLALFENVGGTASTENLIADFNCGFETVDETPPMDISSLSCEVSDSGAVFSWADSTDKDFAGVIVYDITGGKKEKVGEAGKGDGGYKASGLTNDLDYEFLFCAVDYAGNESEGVSISFSPVVPPEAPRVKADDENNVIIGADSTMEIKIDMNPWEDYTGNYDFSGNHVVLVRVKANGKYPHSQNTLLLFYNKTISEEKYPISIREFSLYKNELHFSGRVETNKAANISAALKKGSDYSDYLYLRQLKTDETGEFDISEKILDSHNEIDMSGLYTFSLNSDLGLKSTELTINFATADLRLEAIKKLNETKDLGAVIRDYPGAFETLDCDISSYLSSGEKQASMNKSFLEVLPISETDDALEEAFKKIEFVYDINHGTSESVTQNFVLQSDFDFSYKGSSVLEMLENGLEDEVSWAMKIIDNKNDYVSVDEIREMFSFGVALYKVNHATYSLLSGVLSDNCEELKIENTSEYLKYKKKSDSTAVNKYFVEKAYPDKLTTFEALTGLLNNASTVETTATQTGGGGGGTTTTGAKKGLSSLGDISAIGDTVVTPEKNEFSDLTNYSWAQSAINKLLDKNIISWDSSKSFRPSDPITREEFIKLVALTFKIPTSENNNFNDVDSDKWYSKYVNGAYEAGVVTGREDKTFGVGEMIKRQDMATILSRAIVECGYSSDIQCDIEFLDYDEISEYAKEAVAALTGLGIVNGNDRGEFMPLNNSTRAEAAQMLYKTGLKIYPEEWLND